MRKQFSEEALFEWTNETGIRIVYGYTPICATCTLAERFLNLAIEITPRDLIKVDLNYQEALIEQYQIKSVPVLLAFKDGTLIKTLYRFESVTNLVEFLKNIDD